MGVHDGHRDRLKKRFIEHGFAGMDDHNVLEMLLFYALPRVDTNVLAHELMNRFGSLPNIMEASVEELRQVNGIGENAAVLIAMVTQLNKRYLEQRSVETKVIHSTSEAGAYFVAKFAYETVELAYAMLLDSKNGIICCKQISRGVVNATDINVRSLVELALKYNSASVIIAHNHPRGIAVPSREDEECTRMISNALKLVEVRLVDHIVVAGENYCSFIDMRLM